MVKSVLIYRAETRSLYEDGRRRTKASEMDSLRRPARISKLDRKTNEYIREKINPLNADLNPICHLLAFLGSHHIFHVSRIRFNAQDTILDEITRKQLIWYSHVERMDPTQNGPNVEWTKRRMDPTYTGPNAEWTQRRTDPTQNGPNAEWTQCRMGPTQNGPNAEWTQRRMDPT